jgi:hypothetical protein
MAAQSQALAQCRKNEGGRDRKLMEGEAADTLSAADEAQSSSARMYGFSRGVCRL